MRLLRSIWRALTHPLTTARPAAHRSRVVEVWNGERIEQRRR